MDLQDCHRYELGFPCLEHLPGGIHPYLQQLLVDRRCTYSIVRSVLRPILVRGFQVEIAVS